MSAKQYSIMASDQISEEEIENLDMDMMELEEDFHIPFNKDDPESARKFMDGTLITDDAQGLNRLTWDQFITRYALNKAQGIQNIAFLFQMYDKTLNKLSLMDKEIESNSAKIKESRETIIILEKLFKKYESEKGEIVEEIALLKEELQNLAD